MALSTVLLSWVAGSLSSLVFGRQSLAIAPNRGFHRPVIHLCQKAEMGHP